MTRLSALLLLVSTLLASAYARADARVALVIGNSQYASIDVLPNPRRDASLVASTLRREGFTVTLVLDATRSTMLDALNAFNDQADRADWALVYYAGHGMESGGTSYLLPTDARLRTDRDVQDETVSLPRVQLAVSNARKLRLIILDACRNNLFVSPMKREFAERAVSRGLARPEPEAGTMVVYAAAAGAVADDGAGDHSPFTAALVKRLEQPGLEVSRLFNAVAGDVVHATANRQRPYLYGSILGDEELFFRDRAPVPTPPSRDDNIWSFLKTTKDVVGLKGFLDSLPPASPLRGEVEAYLAKVKAAQPAPAATSTTVVASAESATAEVLGKAPGTGTAASTPAPLPIGSGSSGLAVVRAQRAALLVDAPDDPQRVKTYVGTVVWHLDSISPGGGQPLTNAVKADVDIPEAKLKVTMLMQKNPEAKLPAAYTIEFHFLPQANNILGSIKQVNVPELRKDDDTLKGDSLSGVPVAITDNYFLVGLSRGAAETQNARLMSERNWFDMSVLLTSGKLGKLTFEKGTTGQEMIEGFLRASSNSASHQSTQGQVEPSPPRAPPTASADVERLKPTPIVPASPQFHVLKADVDSEPELTPHSPDPSPFPDAKKVKTFNIRPDGTMLKVDR